MRKNWPFTLRNKLFFFLVFFAAVPIIAFAYWTLQILNNQSEEAVLENLRGLAKTKAQAIESFTQNRVGNIEKLSGLADIISNVKVLTASDFPKVSESSVEKLTALEKEGGGLPQSVEEKRDDETIKAEKKDQDAKKIALEPEKPQSEVKKTPSVNLDDEHKKALTDLKKTLKVLLADQKEFEELLIISPQGVVTASTYDGHEGKSAAGIDYFQNGLKATYLQHVFVSSITEKLTMVISTPVKNETGDVLGVMAARLNLDSLFKLVGDLSGLRKTGESIVAKEINEEIVFMAPTRHDYKAALNRKIAIGSADLRQLHEAVRGGNGMGEIVDYRGVDSLAAWEHIPSLDWGIMVKLDLDEAIQPYMEAQYKTIVLTLLILFAGIILSIYVTNALTRPIKELQEAADRISKGHMDVKLSIFSRDEIGELANSFGRMIASIKFLMEEKEKESGVK